MNFKTFTKQSLAMFICLGLASSALLAQSDNMRKASFSGAFSRIAPGGKLKSQTPKNNETRLNLGKSGMQNKAPGDTVYFQNFDATTTWPADMLRLNVDGKPPGNNAGSTINTQLFGNNAWVTTTQAPDANRFAASLSWTTVGGVVNRWMITPPITLTEANKLVWKARASNASFPDGYEVRLCANCPASITNANVLTTFATTLYSIAAEQSSANFIEREVSLATYSGQTVRLAFRNNSNDQDRLYIDDILVSRPPSTDMASEKILSPSNVVYNCSRANFPAVGVVINKGSSTLYNVGIKMRSNGPINDTVSHVIDSITAGRKDTIYFADGLDMSTVGAYTLTLETNAPGDNNLVNNVSGSTYAHRGSGFFPFSTDFNELSSDSALPQDWFANSRFLPFNNTAGFNGSQSIELPVFNNFGTLGTQSTSGLRTSKYKGITSGSYLTFKYKLVDFNDVEYGMQPGDSIEVSIYKNCEKQANPFFITSANHESSIFYKKIFIPLDPFAFTATDELSFGFKVVSAPTTNNFLFEMDDFNLGGVISNDIALVDLVGVPFSQIKRNQLGTVRFKGSIFNEGLTDLSPVRIVASISPLGIEDTARLSSIASGSQRPFTTGPGFTVGSPGPLQIAIQATVPGTPDPNPANNGTNTTLEVTDSTMAKDFGDHNADVYMQYGPGGGLRIMANAISTTVKDTMTSVSVYVGPITEDCQAKAFFANKNTAGAWVLDSSATIVPITVDMAESWVTLVFRKTTPVATGHRGKPVVANTENLYGVKIRSGNLRVGFNFENATEDGSFIWLGGQLLGTQDITIGGLQGPYSLFIRANFGRPSTLVAATQLEKSLMFAELVPNPAHDGTKLVFSTAKEGQVAISLHTLTGQVLTSQEHYAHKGTNRLDVPVKGLSRGIYLVRISSEGFTTTKKLVID